MKQFLNIILDGCGDWLIDDKRGFAEWLFDEYNPAYDGTPEQFAFRMAGENFMALD